MTTNSELRALLAECLDTFDPQRRHTINYGRLIARITAALSEKDDGGWIPVGERLPEIGVSVLVSEPGFHVQKTCRDQYDWMLPHKSNVTHWQPLPPLPERK